jgi:TRAP-type uncharacterized transport system fused permease subunit
MWVLGTAVPVTASYIIAAVVLVPALGSLGVPLPAAHMFIFYYAVLADVSPPTALAPFAAAAICGGSPLATTMQAWKYTLPAFVVPVIFCLSPDGLGLLLRKDIATAGHSVPPTRPRRTSHHVVAERYDPALISAEQVIMEPLTTMTTGPMMIMAI